MIYSVLEVYMEYKKNLKYFENKKLMLYGSAALLALGLFLWFGPFWSRDNHYVMYIISVISIIAGGVIFAVTVSSRSSDKKIDEQIDAAFRHFEEESLERFDLYERQLSYVNSVSFEGYEYKPDSLIRRDRSGKYRSDTYAKNHVYFTQEEIVIASSSISLIRDEKTDRSVAIPYGDIRLASVRDCEIKYGKVTIRYQIFSVETNGGRTYEYQTSASSEIDTLVADVNHQKQRH